MDALPDIDIDSGVMIDDSTFRGEIKIEAVEFTYQMRPDNKASVIAVQEVLGRIGECGCLVNALATLV